MSRLRQLPAVQSVWLVGELYGDHDGCELGLLRCDEAVDHRLLFSLGGMLERCGEDLCDAGGREPDDDGFAAERYRLDIVSSHLRIHARA